LLAANAPFAERAWRRNVSGLLRIDCRHRQPGMPPQEVGHRQPECLAAELPCRGHVHGFGGGVRIYGLGVRGRGAHLFPAIALRRTRLVALETGNARHNDFLPVGLVYVITNPSPDGHDEWETRER
jgi:hypothetical protein